MSINTKDNNYIPSPSLNYFKNYGSEDFPYWQSVDPDVATHFNHPLLVYGDYANTGAVGKSNVQHILNNDSMVDRLGIMEFSEAYNTTSLMFPIESLDDKELQEILEALDNYPLLDEELFSEIESEMKDESWENYGRSEFHDYCVEQGFLDDSEEDSTIDSLCTEFECAGRYEMGHVDGDSWYFDFGNMCGLSLEQQKEIVENWKASNANN